MSFKEINVNELSINPFEKVGKQWFLVSAGDEKTLNMMTAAWGGMGVMFHKNVFTTVIRPSRKTFENVSENENFVISFLPEKYREKMAFCGKASGHDCDKVKESGLTPVKLPCGEFTFAEAELVFVCKKLYTQPMDLSGLAESEMHWYTGGDAPHVAFTGEIFAAYSNE
ncbi:MAG: flavin reductase [Oscillospiraceae bacterium]|nr:flavin reductase [Oscillospiraceae bacterium]